jgi:hypothetical protein
VFIVLSLPPGFDSRVTLLQVARLVKVIHLRPTHLLARWAASPSLTVRLGLVSAVGCSTQTFEIGGENK